MSRLENCFAALRAENRAAFVPFITAGDPDQEISYSILRNLPNAGADVIELGVPFSDPMADGPAIQASSSRALGAGMSVGGTLKLVTKFRAQNKETPIVLMGYFNPIHAYGVRRFVSDAESAGVDGLITVDLGPEEDEELRGAANAAGIDIVRLATPTTDDARLSTVLKGAGGYLYYVSVSGATNKEKHGPSLCGGLRYSHARTGFGDCENSRCCNRRFRNRVAHRTRGSTRRIQGKNRIRGVKLLPRYSRCRPQCAGFGARLNYFMSFKMLPNATVLEFRL
jgi:tryptophan synthase alpha subunit